VNILLIGESMKYRLLLVFLILNFLACSSALLVIDSSDCSSPVSLSPYVAVQDSGKLYLTGTINGDAVQNDIYKLFVIGGSSFETQSQKKQDQISAAIDVATGKNPNKAIQNGEIVLGMKPSCIYLLFYIYDSETAFAHFKGDLVQTTGDSL